MRGQSTNLQFTIMDYFANDALGYDQGIACSFQIAGHGLKSSPDVSSPNLFI